MKSPYSQPPEQHDGKAETHVMLETMRDSSLQPETDRNAPQVQIPSIGAAPQDGRYEASAEDCSYSVPVEVAARCLGLLLDGSGFSAHRNIFQKRSYTVLGTKPLVDVLKKVFKAESEARANHNVDPSSTREYVRDSMIYSYLLPDHLRKAQEHDSTLISVPEVVLEERGNITVPQYMKVKMNIRKPGRNKKHQNFGVLCALLDHIGPTGICAKTLREYARQGFTTQGCIRRRRNSSSAKSSCTGSPLCQESRQMCSLFINSDQTPIGKGTVDLYATEIDGTEVKEGFIPVRFIQGRNLEDIKFPSNLSTERKTAMYRCWMKGSLTMWPKPGIERIELLGDYGKPIGTGIFVQQLFQADVHGHILKKIRRSKSNSSNMDVINAFIDDVVLENTDNESPPHYPYMEWQSFILQNITASSFRWPCSPKNAHSLCCSVNKSFTME